MCPHSVAEDRSVNNRVAPPNSKKAAKRMKASGHMGWQMQVGAKPKDRGWYAQEGRNWSGVLERVTGTRTEPIYAGDLLRHYAQNEVFADQKYKDRVVVVTGEVNRVVRDPDGNPKVLLTAPEIEDRQLFRNYLVICHFRKSDEKLLVNRQQGDFVHCAGKCLGLREFAGNVYVYVDNCGDIERDYASKLPAYLAGEDARKSANANEAKSAMLKAEAARKEKASQATLRLAKKEIEAGDEKRAEEWLRKVIRRYPGTAAAKEASELLGDDQP